MSIHYPVGSAEGPLQLSFPTRSSPLLPYLGSTLSFSRVVFTLTPFPPSLRIRGWISEFPSLFPPLRRGSLILSLFFRKSQREYVGVSAREGREGGRKGINISESRSLRRKLEEPDDNVTFVRSLVPSFSIIFKESQSGRRTAQEGPVGKDRTKKAVKTNALSAFLPPACRPLHSIPLWRLEMDDPSSIIPSPIY